MKTHIIIAMIICNLFGIIILNAQNKLDEPPNTNGKKAIELLPSAASITILGDANSTAALGDVIHFGTGNNQQYAKNAALFMDINVPEDGSYLVYIQMSQGNPDGVKMGSFYFDVVTSANEALISDGKIEELPQDRVFNSFGTGGMLMNNWYEIQPIDLKKGKNDFALVCTSASSGQIWISKIILLPNK